MVEQRPVDDVLMFTGSKAALQQKVAEADKASTKRGNTGRFGGEFRRLDGVGILFAKEYGGGGSSDQPGTHNIDEDKVVFV